MMPSMVLKKLIMGDSATVLASRDPTILDSIYFMRERLDQLSQSELASRLTLNCMNCYVEPHKLQTCAITIVDVSAWV